VDFDHNTALIIVGPTGIGKTEVSLEIAKHVSCEIVSADSRQVYRFMDIGTSKPSKEVLCNIKHHFINILNPDQDYSAGQYAKEAREIINQIFNRKYAPLVVGGSGLYVKALLEGFFGDDFRDESVREQLQNRMDENGTEHLYAELQKVDPQSAVAIHPNNTKRILRSLEVYYITGQPISRIQTSRKDPAPFPWIKFGLTMKREKLYERINQRVDKMFQDGLVEEVQNLLKKGYSSELNSLNSVGYKEVINYLNNKMDLGECTHFIKQNTRRYAKRQLTWFRKEEDINWVIIENPENFTSQIANSILEQYNRLN
jgi:tRNA dimethylallyltransferase